MFNVMYGQPLCDLFSMSEVFRRDCLYLWTGIRERNRIDFDVEIITQLLRKGIARTSGELSVAIAQRGQATEHASQPVDVVT